MGLIGWIAIGVAVLILLSFMRRKPAQSGSDGSYDNSSSWTPDNRDRDETRSDDSSGDSGDSSSD